MQRRAAAASLHPLRLGHVGAPLSKACLLACLSCAPPRYYPQQHEVSVLDVQLFRPGRLTKRRLSYGSPGPWAGGQIHCGWVLPTCSHGEISPMGGNGVSPSRQIDSLQRARLGSSCPGPGSMQKARHRTTPEDPSVRLVWNLPQSVRPQTLLQDNPSLESGRTSLGLSAHSSTPGPPPADALASPTRRVNLSLPPPV